MSDLIDILRSIRKEQGISQRALAERIGCCDAEICFWETHQRDPQFKTINAWAEALGYEFDLHKKEPANV